MAGIFRRAFERRASTADTAAWASENVWGGGTPTAAGKSVGTDSARRVATVWACQSLIADAIASLPVDTYRKTVGSKRKTLVDNPSWLDNPNPFETRYTFWHKVMISLLGEDGNAFILTPRDPATNAILGAYVADPSIVWVDEESTVPHYTVNGTDAYAADVIHIPAFTIPGRRRGISVIDHAREAIGLALAAEEFGARFFAQGTTMSGVVEHPGTPKPGEVAIMAKTLRKTHAGVKNSHAVGILTGGATWKQVSITPEQAQFLDTRRFQNLEIAKLYRVPPHMVDPTAPQSWADIEEQNLGFAQDTLVPWLVRIEQAITRVLPGQQFIKFNLDARLRGKTADRMAAYGSAISNGVMSPDEAREKEDLEPIPGGKGKAFLISANLKELGAAPAPPPAPPAPAPTNPPAGNGPDGGGNADGN